jgi:hypothetical protein
MLRRFLMSACLSGLVAFSSSPQTGFVPDSKRVEDVHEASYRYFFIHDLARSNALAFCISSAKPLAPNFLKRFANSDPPVVWLSECQLSRGKSGPLTARRDQAVQIGIMSVRWISAIEAEVRGGCHSGELGGTQELLHLALRNGRWTVVGVELTVIS